MAENLPEKLAVAFPYAVAQQLALSQHAHRDIELLVYCIIGE